MNDYDDKHENIEGFSRSVVVSLFDGKKTDEKKSDEKTSAGAHSHIPSEHSVRPQADNEEDRQSPDDAPPTWDLFLDESSAKGSRKPAPYKRHVKEPDPEAVHEAYLSSASEAIRRQQQRDEEEKEAALRHKEQQWDEMAQISKKMRMRDDMLWEEGEEPWEPIKDPRALRKPLPPINVRNVASLGLFVTLIIFGLLVWQNVSVNSRLTTANAQVAELQMQLTELAELRAENVELDSQVARLQSDVNRLSDYIDELTSTVPANGTNQNNNQNNANQGSANQNNQTQDSTTNRPLANVPHSNRDAEGRMIYIVQQGDNLWRIAERFYGAGAGTAARVAAIREANGISGDGIQAGNPIIIPD